MTLRTRCLHIAVSLLMTGGGAAAQDAASALQGASSAKPTTIVASVEAIDQANRMVTLKGPKGNLIDIYVDESRKGFDQLKVGDEIKATYYESFLIHVRTQGEPAPTSGDTAALTPRIGGSGGTLARQITATVTITAIDADVPSVTVKDEKDHVYSMRVQDPKRLATVKVGDIVDVTYTQALLLSLEK
jgi:hypothetical protein